MYIKNMIIILENLIIISTTIDRKIILQVTNMKVRIVMDIETISKKIKP